MTKLVLTIELDYDADIMHADDPDAIEWFYEDILQGEERLTLHSFEIGDTVGDVTVLRIHPDGEMGEGQQ